MTYGLRQAYGSILFFVYLNKQWQMQRKKRLMDPENLYSYSRKHVDDRCVLMIFLAC